MKSNTTPDIEYDMTSVTHYMKMRSKEINEAYKRNEALIAHWKSIPWWKFWIKKPSFEEQKRIVVNNYRIPYHL